MFNVNSIVTYGVVTQLPWSGYYWPIAYGLLSVRFGSQSTIGYDWSTSVNMYYQPSQHNQNYGTSSFASLVANIYSPAEKYDFAVGDFAYTSTNADKNYGINWAVNGVVPTWMGICHGWTPASSYYNKPTYAVTITAYDGSKVTFLPDDLRALASMLWANASYYTQIAGGVNNVNSINPGSTILILSNTVGQGQNIIMDPNNSDDQVWNQPVYDYTITWYNLITNAEGGTPSNLATTLSSMRASKISEVVGFANTASPYASYCIGAIIQIYYVVENTPEHVSTRDDPSYIRYVQAYASIDLDNNFNIIGGTWGANQIYPNFFWRPAPGNKPYGIYDGNLSSFNGVWSSGIKNLAVSSSKYRSPLKAIVEYLLQNSY